MEELMRVEHISKEYENGDKMITTKALKDVSFSVNKGEMLAIMGSSGSGKSTLLNILGALDEPSAGTIFFHGEEKENYSKEPYATEMRKKYIGFVFQDFSLLQDLSVRENIEIPLILQEKDAEECKKRVEQIGKIVGLDKRMDYNVKQLSGGQQQRVAIARAVIMEPELLLADEPTGNLDYNTSMDIMKLFLELKKEKKQTILLVTHDPVVATFADRVLFFHDGEQKVEYCNQENGDNFTEILKVFRSLS